MATAIIGSNRVKSTKSIEYPVYADGKVFTSIEELNTQLQTTPLPTGEGVRILYNGLPIDIKLISYSASGGDSMRYGIALFPTGETTFQHVVLIEDSNSGISMAQVIATTPALLQYPTYADGQNFNSLEELNSTLQNTAIPFGATGIVITYNQLPCTINIVKNSELSIVGTGWFYNLGDGPEDVTTFPVMIIGSYNNMHTWLGGQAIQLHLNTGETHSNFYGIYPVNTITASMAEIHYIEDTFTAAQDNWTYTLEYANTFHGAAAGTGDIQYRVCLIGTDNTTKYRTAYKEWTENCVTVISALTGSPIPILSSNVYNGESGVNNITLIDDYGGVWNALNNTVTLVFNSVGNYKVNDLTETEYGLYPNIFYQWGEVSSLSLRLLGGDFQYASEYMFQFTSGNTPTTLTFTPSVSWIGDNTIEANKTYQVSVYNNVAVLGEITNGD